MISHTVFTMFVDLKPECETIYGTNIGSKDTRIPGVTIRIYKKNQVMSIYATVIMTPLNQQPVTDVLYLDKRAPYIRV